MAKIITLTTVKSKAHYGEPALTANFSNLNNNYLNFLHLDGVGQPSNTMLGDLDLGNKKVLNSGAPSNPFDLATKAYVDAAALVAATGTLVDTQIDDADSDTGVQSEATADIDRLDIFAGTSGGAANAIEVTGNDAAVSSLSNPFVKVLKNIVLDTDVRIGDAATPNTYIELTDTGNADIIQFVANAVSMIDFDGPNSELKSKQNMSFVIGKGLVDLDGDTKIQLENLTDDDIIRFDVEGTEALQIIGNVVAANVVIEPQVNIRMRDDAATLAGARLGDEDGDTYIIFNEAVGGTDDDTMRVYASGTEVARFTSSGVTFPSGTTNLGVSGSLGAGVTTFPTGGDKGVNIAEGSRPTGTNLNNNEVFITAINNVDFSGQSDLIFDFKDSASTKTTVILGEDCTFPRDVTVTRDLTVSNSLIVNGITFGAFTALADADIVLTSSSATTLTINPTVERTITLPTTNIKGSAVYTIINLSNTVRVVILSSDLDVLARTIGGMVTFLSTQDTPTDRLHWRKLGGAMDLLDTQEASSSPELDFTGIDAAYDKYLFIFNSVLPATDATSLEMLLSTDGGVSYHTVSGDYTSNYNFLVAGVNNIDAGPRVRIELSGGTIGNLNTEGLSGEISMYNPARGNKPLLEVRTTFVGPTNSVSWNGGSHRFNANSLAVDAARFKMVSGNIASGRISMYGIKR